MKTVHWAWIHRVILKFRTLCIATDLKGYFSNCETKQMQNSNLTSAETFGQEDWRFVSLQGSLLFTTVTERTESCLLKFLEAF